MTESSEVMERLAAQVRTAVESADLAAYRDLLDPDVHWGAPGDPSPTCQNCDQVLAWYRRGRDAGTRAQVFQTLVHGDQILVGLTVTGRSDAEQPDGERWQVLTVRCGRVVDIAGFDDATEAAEQAGLAPATSRPQVARWSAPATALGDDLVELRLPRPSDADTLHAYASADGALAGGWLPLQAGVSPQICHALVADWLAGWQSQRSFHGPVLVIQQAGGGELTGLVGIGESEGNASDDAGARRTVELAYRVAPQFRGRGYATSAVRLAARWLLHSGQAALVGRIDRGNAASLRVAHAAGFEPAGVLRSKVRSTGECYDDLRFILRPG